MSFDSFSNALPLEARSPESPEYLRPPRICRYFFRIMTRTKMIDYERYQRLKTPPPGGARYFIDRISQLYAPPNVGDDL